MDIIPLDRFQERLREDLLDIKRVAKKNSWSDLLSLWVAQHFLRLENASGLLACGMQGSGEEGIDLFCVQDGSSRVIVGQAETGEELNLQGTFSRSLIDKLRRALAALNDSKLAANKQSPIATCIEDYTEAVSKGYAVEFWVIIAGAEDQGLQKACRRFEAVDLKNYPKHTLKIINASAMLTKYCADIEKLPYPNIELHIPRNEFFKHNENSLLATVSGKSIAKAVTEKGLHIFETNARLPLLRSEINLEISATVNKADGRENFWNFNNGLTILCENFHPVDNGKLKIECAQIVNGCQSAYTLSKSDSKLDDVEVICRVIRKAPRMLSETHGNLTVLALVGKVIRQKYALELPIKGPAMHNLKIHLLPRFENPEDYSEFFHTFAKAIAKLLKGLDKWVERAAKKQKREIGAIDIRKIFIASATFQKITNDGVMRSIISKAQKQLPPLN